MLVLQFLIISVLHQLLQFLKTTDYLYSLSQETVSAIINEITFINYIYKYIKIQRSLTEIYKVFRFESLLKSIQFFNFITPVHSLCKTNVPGRHLFCRVLQLEKIKRPGDSTKKSVEFSFYWKNIKCTMRYLWILNNLRKCAA